MKILLSLTLLLCLGCKAQPRVETQPAVETSQSVESSSAKEEVITGDACTDLYYPLLSGKRVALFGNHTALLPNGEHLLDKLLADSIQITAAFSPEHGFRGKADAGASGGAG